MIFRWDSDTIRVTILGVIFVLGCVATAFQAPWFTTVFVSGLTGSWIIAERGRYWRGRQLEQLLLTGGSKGRDGEGRFDVRKGRVNAEH